MKRRRLKSLSFDEMLQHAQQHGQMPPREQRPSISVFVGSAEGYVGRHLEGWPKPPS